jgi:cytochrome c oxidase cbb3-type subunit 2
MKSLPLIFLGVFFTLAFSWTGIVLTTHRQLVDSESMLPTTAVVVDAEGNALGGPTFRDTAAKRDVPGFRQEQEELFPRALSGAAQRGQRVYEQLGCLYCHSQQVRRGGFGSDLERGWGNRQSVARDYIFHDRVMLGTMRTGPDLANVGTRYTKLWQHQHLYSPQSVNSWSLMPSFAYPLRNPGSGPRGPVERRHRTASIAWKHSGRPFEVIPSQRAKDLVAYLMALDQNYELPEIKFSE